MKDGCPFCEYDGELLADFRDVVVFEPLNPVVPGHVLVVPRLHVQDALERPEIAGRAFEAAALYARNSRMAPVNLISSVGAEATQTVFHLHVHVVPRRAGDALALPWTVDLPRP